MVNRLQICSKEIATSSGDREQHNTLNKKLNPLSDVYLFARHHHQCSFYMIVHTECNFDSHAKQQLKNNFKYLLFLAFLFILA